MNPTSCLHCGRVNPAAPTSAFCCAGCEAVYGYLSNQSLAQDFYRLKAESCPLPGAILGGAKVQTEDFSFLDHPDFFADYVRGEDQSLRLFLSGLQCSACLWLLEQLPRLLPGLGETRVDLSRSLLMVRLGKWPHDQISKIPAVIESLGYGVKALKNDGSDAIQALRGRETKLALWRIGVAAATAGNLMLFGVAVYAGAGHSWERYLNAISGVLFLPTITFCAVPFFRSVYQSFSTRTLSIDVPIVLAIVVGSAVSYVHLLTGNSEVYFDSVATLVFLLLASRTFLASVQQKVWSIAEGVAARAPLLGSVLVNSVEGSTLQSVPASQLQVGQRVRCRAGEWIAADGEVDAGRGVVSFAQFTGEPSPRNLTQGEKVFAGTTLLSGEIYFTVKQPLEKSYLGSLLLSLKERTFEKTRFSEFSNRLSGVLILGVLCAFFWVLASQGFGSNGLSRALAMLIVTCPCAFALATPLTLSLAMGRTLEGGILINSPSVFEKLSSSRSLLWDKTGTLSDGMFKVWGWNWLVLMGVAEKNDLVGRIVSLERQFKHPVAQAILNWIENGSGSEWTLAGAEDPLKTFKYFPGRGVEGVFESGKRLEIVSAQEGGDSRTTLQVRDGDQVVMHLQVGDRLRSDAPEAIEKIDGIGIQQGIISGDAKEAVLSVGKAVGLAPQDLFWKATAEEKAAKVKDNQVDIFVGDGLNDAPALSVAKVGIAVSGGIQAALQNSDVVLLKTHLGQLPKLLIYSRKVMRILIGNLVFSTLYNLGGVWAAYHGLVSPLFAAVLMPMSALTVFGWNFLFFSSPVDFSGSGRFENESAPKGVTEEALAS